jgi:hypothetical protein
MSRRGQHVTFDPAANEASGQYKIWRAIAVHRRFDYADIAASSGATLHTVKSYVRRLVQVGILRREGPHPRPVFVLVRRRGPFAPVLRRDGTVFDPNRGGQVLFPASGAEVDHAG